MPNMQLHHYRLWDKHSWNKPYFHPGNYNCDSSNIVYVLVCNKCNYGNYVGETSAKFRLGMNNHKKSIRDSLNGLPVAIHYNQTDHCINEISCVVLNRSFTTDRQLYEKKIIQKFKCGLNREWSFLSSHTFFNMSKDLSYITLEIYTRHHYYHL